VSDVVVEDVGPYVRRSMRFNGQGPMAGQMMRQHIYVDAAAREIRFNTLAESGEEEEVEADLEVVNALRVTQTHVAIEYFQRRVRSGERERWAAPRARTVAAIERTVAIARGECS
jgi:hypothetical protein